MKEEVVEYLTFSTQGFGRLMKEEVSDTFYIGRVRRNIGQLMKEEVSDTFYAG